MNTNPTNLCIICGKQRVDVKTHTEKVGSSSVTYISSACPDENCQRKVDKMLAKEKAKRQFIKSESEKREKTRLHRIQASRSKV